MHATHACSIVKARRVVAEHPRGPGHRWRGRATGPGAASRALWRGAARMPRRFRESPHAPLPYASGSSQGVALKGASHPDFGGELPHSANQKSPSPGYDPERHK